MTNTKKEQPDTYFWNRQRRENFMLAVKLGIFKTTAEMDSYLNGHPLDEQREQILKENKQCKL